LLYLILLRFGFVRFDFRVYFTLPLLFHCLVAVVRVVAAVPFLRYSDYVTRYVLLPISVVRLLVTYHSFALRCSIVR